MQREVWLFRERFDYLLWPSESVVGEVLNSKPFPGYGQNRKKLIKILYNIFKLSYIPSILYFK